MCGWSAGRASPAQRFSAAASAAEPAASDGPFTSPEATITPAR